MHRPPDEQALRTPGFRDGVRVTLGDGREWTIPAATVSLDPTEEGSGLVLAEDEVELLCASDFDHAGEFVDTLVKLAARMLAANYAVSSDDLAAALEYDYGCEASVAMWKKVVAAIRGSDGARTYTAWLRMSLASNGVDPKGMKLKDAVDMANRFVVQGRAVPSGEWVDDAVNKRRRAEYKAMAKQIRGF